ncbi:hypothetical protein TorRG33x02_030130 [Trema orientale]|uniref:Neprosin PEP catalytic domain-containing protein n=1 Tax=Trema orientale TaxID=63057 RepID=A0A2P5FU10_TREOI|nr:hypothetical protein TorRG33x02_030130 [Trema orientale]
MRPSSRPKMNWKESSTVGKIPLETGLKGKGCPIGTVPIRRTTKEDLIRSRLFTHNYASRFSSLIVDKPGLHHAALRTKPDPNKKYNGGGVVTSAYQPSVTVSQYSSSQMTIQNGLDTIQVGWTVNPSLYGDNKTRLFTFFQAGATSCFNTHCPGFIIVDTRIPLDLVLEPISQRGGPIYDLTLFVYRDQANGNWWLEFGRSNTQIGFWPARIFSGLTDLATYMEWGGEAYSPPGQPSPPMGNSFFPSGDESLDAFCEHITTINEAHDPVDAENTEEFTDDVRLYKVDDWGIRGKAGHVFGFGGPGES